MHQIHDNGCLQGALKENVEKETSAVSIMFYFLHLKNIQNLVASRGRELDIWATVDRRCILSYLLYFEAM